MNFKTMLSKVKISCFVVSYFFVTLAAFGAQLPLTFTSEPSISSMINQSTQFIMYTITNNTLQSLPITISGISFPVILSIVPPSNPCGNFLSSKQSCNIRLSITPQTVGQIKQVLKINYGGRNPLISVINLNVTPNTLFAQPFMGVDYAPAHYNQGDPRNDEDEANVYPELNQLSAAGFKVVRMYGRTRENVDCYH